VAGLPDRRCPGGVERGECPEVGGPLETRLQELRDDRSHGGSWLARHAVEALLDESARAEVETSDELVARLVEVGRELAEARPGIGSIAGAVSRVLAAADTSRHLPLIALQALVAEEGQGLVAARDRAAASIAIQLTPMLDDALVLTHSDSATVREAVLHTPPARIVCTVSAPFEEGRRLADDLRDAGLEVDLVADEEAAEAVRECSLLLLGADTVFRDGVVCNKVGTAELAAAAAAEGARTVVACELFKLAPRGAPPESEEPELFDLTPAEHVDLVVTEEGSFAPSDAAAMVDRTPFLRQGYALLRGERAL
jgi:translation initiation factor 2B subunit (eIF-2B alpha/beta/delta family)